MPTSAVTAQIAYLNDEWKGRDELARIYSRETRHANTTKRDVEVRDGRPEAEAGLLDLDRNGFVLVSHETQFTDFDNKTAIEGEYFAEMRELILEVTGAVDALPFPFYQLRSRHPANFFDAYSLYMHCDFSLNSWHAMAQRIISEQGGGREYPPERYDFALYNMWRPIGQAVLKSPLAIVDASSVDPDDILEYRLAPTGTTSLAALPVFNPSHRHYYFPHMQTDEVLVFKQQDSRPGVARVCPHTAFVDPESPIDAAERRSIDIRMVCVFDKA